MDLHELEAQVREMFAHGPPNGWLLGWDRDRNFEDFRRVVAPYPTVNNTSFDYAFCNHFDLRVELARGSYAVLTVLISFVADVYSMHWTRYEPGGRSGQVYSGPAEGRDVEGRVARWLHGIGFAALPDELYGLRLEGLELELSGKEDVILGKCLFQDFEG